MGTSESERRTFSYVCEECDREVESELDTDSFVGLCETCTDLKTFKRKEE